MDTRQTAQLTATPEEWMKGAIEHTGSWWNYWEQWISPFVGKKV